MGWAHCGRDDAGREIGYGVAATCDHEGCGAAIDRGLAHVCGGMHGGGDHGCGGYFCPRHLAFSRIGGKLSDLCESCTAARAGEQDEDRPQAANPAKPPKPSAA